MLYAHIHMCHAPTQARGGQVLVIVIAIVIVPVIVTF